ncbi:unnamed protein product [Polarella glacialis]|uniref:Uncharacterized protein n=1 Tax=Polarella glacialis TaxID=89957 RepID=A0A813D6X4_POLGL|nr:unnamed protein product [Polarella glacialis]
MHRFIAYILEEVAPNYDDFSCKWKFGVKAPPLQEDEALMVPCFTNCPSKITQKDALSSRQKLRAGGSEAAYLAASDERLRLAVEELTPDGTALSKESLEERGQAVKSGGKCWSVDEKRAAKREMAGKALAAQA